jgi:predicted dinucleotide-binding enzyme
MSRTVLYVKEAKTYGTTSGGSNTTFVLEVVPERIVAEFNRTFAERSRGKH